MAAVNHNYICLACNTPFSGRKRKYCSNVCAETDRQLRWNNKRRKGLVSRTCLQCSISFSGARDRRYCSRSCAAASKSQYQSERVRDSRRERWQAEVGKGVTSLSFEDWKKKKQRKGNLDRSMDRLAEANAKQAWQYWLSNLASDQWLDAYWLATGKPWNNPRLSVAEKFTLRYESDKKFRAKEVERRRLFKWSHPEVVAMQENDACNRRRWNQAAIRADGSITKTVVADLLRQKFCPYCLCRLTKQNRHIDHITPLSQDGAHSITNVVACCASCNRSKGAKKLWQWALSSRWVCAKAA